MKKILFALLVALGSSLFTYSEAQIITMHNFANSEEPFGSLTLSGNVLYGMTADGGTNGRGLIFSIHTDSSHYKILWNFDDTGLAGHANGGIPYGNLLLIG